MLFLQFRQRNDFRSRVRRPPQQERHRGRQWNGRRRHGGVNPKRSSSNISPSPQRITAPSIRFAIPAHYLAGNALPPAPCIRPKYPEPCTPCLREKRGINCRAKWDTSSLCSRNRGQSTGTTSGGRTGPARNSFRSTPSSKRRLVVASTRTSTLMVRLPPTLSTPAPARHAATWPEPGVKSR